MSERACHDCQAEGADVLGLGPADSHVWRCYRCARTRWNADRRPLSVPPVAALPFHPLTPTRRHQRRRRSPQAKAWLKEESNR